MPHTTGGRPVRIAMSWFLFFPLALGAAEPSADEIVKRADDARGPSGTYSFQVSVEDRDDSGVIRETGYKVYSKDITYTLVETISPERLKGRKLLMRENDLWLYLPTVKRPTRVSFQQRLTGEVSNGDLARTNFYKDYEPTLEGSETIKDKSCYKLGLVARNKEVTYRRITYWVEKTTFHPVQAEFFAISGKLLKTGEYLEFGGVLDKQRVTAMVIRDALQPSKQSRMKYSNYRRETLNDSFFNKESLAE
jgi:hypothetical protein